MSKVSIAADIAGISSAIFSLFAWIKARQIERELYGERAKTVKIALVHGGQIKELPGSVRRGQLTRAEILGRIGMIPTKAGGRFIIAYVNSPSFLEDIEKVLDSRSNAIIRIPCTQQEIEQFDFSRNQF
ncbi:MAG: hypothetical protein AAFP07_19960 [Cyanobacteria bacterium J06606_4]